MDPGQIVTTFIQAMERLDIDSACDMLADDVLYENVPIGPVQGRDAVRQTILGFTGPTQEMEWKVLRQDVAGATVWNERVDRFRMGERWVELPVAGVFEVRDGKITLWRDYFDLATFTTQMQG